MKQLHFYTDLTNEEQTSEWDLDTMCVDFITTRNEIEKLKNLDGIVKTTQLSFLNNSLDYEKEGIEVFLHIRNETIKVQEKGNVLELLINGTFGEI